MASRPSIRKSIRKTALAALLLGLVPASGNADSLYWDTNGSTEGTTAGAVGGTWDNDTTAVWSSDPDGNSATGLWSDGADVVFSAGSNGTGAQTVTLLGTINVHGITIEDGSVTLTKNKGDTAKLILGAGGITIGSAAKGKLSFNSALEDGSNIVITADQTWTNASAFGGFSLNSGLSSSATTGQVITLTIAGIGGNSTSALGYGIGDGTAGGKLAINYTSAGQLTLSSASTYSGGTTLNGGSGVIVFNISGTGSPGNPTNGPLGNGAVTITGGTVQMRSSTSTARKFYNSVILDGDIHLVTSTTKDETLTFAGPVTISGATRTINADASQSAFPLGLISGDIGDGGNNLGLTKTGAGALVLSGNNTYTGATTIQAGKLVIDGSLSAAGTVVVGDAGSAATTAILAGGGSVGDVSLGAVAGNTGAQLDPGGSDDGSVGKLTVGNFTQGNGAHLTLQLGSPVGGGNAVGGVDYDQVATTGAISLTSAGGGSDLQLSLLSGFSPSGDSLYFILVNGSSQTGGVENLGQFTSLNGVAGDLGQDAVFTLDGVEFAISYTADFDTRTFDGVGNDIALMAVPEPGVPALFLGAICALGLAGFTRRSREG